MTDDVAEAQRRIAEFARTKDPADLWPGVSEAARVAAAREIERVTRRVLAGARGVALDGDAAALMIAGHTTGMGPVVGRWLEDGTADAGAEVRQRFARHLDHARRRHARIEAEVLPALDALLALGITPVLLKGAHTARAYFEEPGVRRMADVDVLVPRERVDDVEAALRTAGLRPEHEAHRPYKRDWIRADIDDRYHSVELWDARSRWSLEVHASLDRRHHPGAVAPLDAVRAHLDAVGDGTITLDVAGRPLRALGQPLLLLALACHGAQELDGSRLLRLYELARVIRLDVARGTLDWDAVVDLLRRTRTARWAWPALALVEELAPGTVDARVLALGRRASTWAARHTVARLTPAGGALDARGVLRQLMWDRGPVALAQRVLRTAWPAAFTRPADVLPGWRVRWRRLRAGAMSLGAPDERRL
jgi:hypothetical protein